MNTSVVRKAVPTVGVEFGLMLVKAPTLEEILELNGVSKKEMDGWRHIGEEVVLGPHRFKLKNFGIFFPNLEETRKRLGRDAWTHGAFQKAFLEQFPESDGLGPIGFPDPSWVDKDGKVWFPTLTGEIGEPWQAGLGFAQGGRGPKWRWLTRSWCESSSEG